MLSGMSGRERVGGRRRGIDEHAAAHLPVVAQRAFGADMDVDGVVPVLRLHAVERAGRVVRVGERDGVELAPAEPHDVRGDVEVLDRPARDAHGKAVGLRDRAHHGLIVERAREADRHVAEVRLRVVEIELHRAAVVHAEVQVLLDGLELDADIRADTPGAAAEIGVAVLITEVDVALQLEGRAHHLQTGADAKRSEFIGDGRVDVERAQRALGDLAATDPVVRPLDGEPVRREETDAHREVLGDAARRVDLERRDDTGGAGLVATGCLVAEARHDEVDAGPRPSASCPARCPPGCSRWPTSHRSTRSWSTPCRCRARSARRARCPPPTRCSV